MKNAEGKPICGADTTPLDPRTWRPKRVWSRSHCRRVVRQEGDRCYQHQPPPPEGEHPIYKEWRAHREPQC